MGNTHQISDKLSSDTDQHNFWAKAVADQIASGTGAERFCQQHQINFSKFHYWKYYKVKPDFCHNNSTNKLMQG